MPSVLPPSPFTMLISIWRTTVTKSCDRSGWSLFELTTFTNLHPSPNFSLEVSMECSNWAKVIAVCMHITDTKVATRVHVKTVKFQLFDHLKLISYTSTPTSTNDCTVLCWVQQI